jgi:hypothetical protein
MLNSLEAYAESGRKTAEARNKRDEAGAMFEKDWFTRARRLEKEEDRAAIDLIYNEAYRAARRPGC